MRRSRPRARLEDGDARSRCREDLWPTEEGAVPESGRYEFRVAQRVSATAVAAFPELSVTDGSPGTVLYGPVRDDAELHGILSRLQLLGLTILDVHRLPD
jgi:hypothetical protein